MLTVFMLFIFPSLSSAATAYYVDCSAPSNGSGTFSKPFNSLRAVNTAKSKFIAGDGLFFKVNTTCFLNSDTDSLIVSWSGTDEQNRVVIGAYYGDGKFGLGGHNRPIINGKNRYPSDYQGGFFIKNQKFVTIKDLRFEGIGNSVAKSPKAVMVHDSRNIDVENCLFYRSSYGSIEYARVNTGVIRDNVIEQSGYPNWARVGAAIEVTAANREGSTTNILITRNKVFNSKHEGIGLYKKVTNSIIEYNVVRDIRSFFIYIDAGKNNTIRHNLVYETNEIIHSSFARQRSSYAIAIDNEDERKYVFSGGNQIYGNLIGGTRRGISLSCGIKSTFPSAACYPNDKVYNNTIVDTDTQFSFSGTGKGDNVVVKNNISRLITTGIGSTHVGSGGFNASGVTWSHNFFAGGPAVTGNAAISMVTGNLKMNKNSGWRTITGELKGNEFLPDIGSVDLINRADANIPNKARMFEVDYSKMPIRVKITTPDKPIIGSLLRVDDKTISTIQPVTGFRLRN
jgi:hypothetical protein